MLQQCRTVIQHTPKRCGVRFVYTQAQPGYWDVVSNQRTFLDDLAKKLNIKNQEGWYKVSASIVRQNGGPTLLWKYNNSLISMLLSVYPEYQ